MKDCVEAVKLAGTMLIASGVIEERYVDAMVKVAQELGPYTVLASGVAMPHARSEDGAKRIGLSILIIKNGINFNSPNDPVYVVIGFAAIDKTSHLSILKELAELLYVPDIVEKLRNASSRGEEEVVVGIIKNICNSKPHNTMKHASTELKKH